ncbi:MAG: chemotaxis protein CheW [Gammaproteobacteria bacterium]|nr:chemotaxis protein CheW [Gammaproteobacteria bacterium]
MEATKRKLQEDYCGLVLTYRVNDTLLCVPVEHVESVIEPPKLTDIPNAPSYVMGAFLHRGKAALALSLNKLLRLPSTAGEHGKKESLLVVWMGDHPVGYWVDEIKGMTDSSRGHWSAVPALIRDQGITRALVCDGNVFFPLDLTQSKQFGEIFRTLETLEKNRVHEVTEEDVKRVQQETQRAEQQGAEALLEPEQEIIPEDDYKVAEFPADREFEEDYEDHIQTKSFTDHEPEIEASESEFDTSALAQQMYEARFAPADSESTQQTELDYDESGQADAFLSEKGDKTELSEQADQPTEEASNESIVDERQLDAFDQDYLESLKLETIELLFDEHGQADAFLQLLEKFDEPTREIDTGSLDEASNEPFIDESQIDAFDPEYQKTIQLEQTQDIRADDQDNEGLALTEEPYSYLPTSLADDEVQDDSDASLDYEKLFSEDEEEHRPDGDVDELSLNEEPYSLLPARLPDEEGSESDIETTSYDDQLDDLPDMDSTLARADYYADRIAETWEVEPGLDDEAIPPAAREDRPLAKADSGFITDIPEELEIEPEEDEIKTRGPIAPMPGGIIIRPDGQVSKSFGLIKVFTIVLATSAAGAWWFRDELFHREHIRKEIPSILQNEIAYLYSERVKIVNPPRGKTRMLVETPDEEIKVIKRKYVNRDLLRERRKKGVKLHRVRRGDTLWDIAQKYLADPYRYPELAENNRIHNPDLIRSGDVVKITVKKTDKK